MHVSALLKCAMRSKVITIALAISLSVLFAAQSQAESSEAGYPAVAIQEALIWTGHTDRVPDGRIGPLTRRAISQWQTSRGFPTDGKLTREQAALLVDDARVVREQVFRWEIFRSKLGYSIGYPRAYFGRVIESPHGSAKFHSGIEGYELETAVLVRLSDAEYQQAFEAISKNATYSVIRPAFFVATARTATGGYVYTRLERRSEFAVTFIVSIPGDADPRWRAVITAMSSSFSVPATLNVRVVPPPSVGTLPAAPIAGLSNSRGHPISLKDGSGQTELSAEQVYAAVSAAVYTVYSVSSARDVIQGSAVAVSPKLVLTNCHVLDGQAALLVSAAGEKIAASLLASDRDKDRCVLETQVSLTRFVTVRTYDSLRIGERVYAIGSPRGLDASLSDGLISALRSTTGIRLIQTSAPISKGSSGGGLFDRYANLIGITTLYVRDAQNLNFAIAAEDFFK